MQAKVLNQWWVGSGSEENPKPRKAKLGRYTDAPLRICYEITTQVQAKPIPNTTHVALGIQARTPNHLKSKR